MVKNNSAASFRLLNRDGTFNISRKGIRRAWVRDLYHTLLSVHWFSFLALLVGMYLIVNLGFALAYQLCGPDALEGASRVDAYHHFLDAFFFSIQTFATIGYGKITPNGVAANLLVSLEALVGLLGFALATGLLFSKFSRPTARVIFSKVALITPHEGVSSLVFRMGNSRLNQIVEAKVSVVLAKNEKTLEGETYRNFYDLELERKVSPIFALSWTVVHPITDQSPLKGLTAEDLLRDQAEIFVSLIGIDDTFSAAIHSRFSYTPQEILWNRYFDDILSRDERRNVVISLHKIHDVH